MEEAVKAHIQKKAEAARLLYEGSSLYGTPLDLNDPEHLLAVIAVQQEENASMRKEVKRLREVSVQSIARKPQPHWFWNFVFPLLLLAFAIFVIPALFGDRNARPDHVEAPRSTESSNAGNGEGREQLARQPAGRTEAQ